MNYFLAKTDPVTYCIARRDQGVGQAPSLRGASRPRIFANLQCPLLRLIHASINEAR
jgi:hypothetical protein